MKNLLKISTVALALTPLFILAKTNADSVLDVIGELLGSTLRLLFLGALVFFVYGVIKYVISVNSDDKGNARKVVIKGIIGLFIMTSVWGIVGVIQATFNIGSGGALSEDAIPSIKLK
jgi:cell division protein FtsW (lipid II flippase)